MIGETLGPYRIDRELGSGGMGKVYAAVVEGRCPGLDEGARVALKVVHPRLLETDGFFKRFLREGEIGKAVRHPNVVRTFDCDQVVAGGSANAFLVMEYVEGQTLRELLEELDRVPEELCRHIAREVCKGLSAIHAAGVIHRDMKPDNVLITEDHVVKVMDLGVARLTDEVLRLSQTGAFVGSIHYAAPECFREGGKHVDTRADLHALGLVLYELSCGTNPYLADDIPQILKKVLHEEPRRLGDINPQLSPFFEELVHRLLAKAPDERFATADELLGVLEEGEDSAWWHARARSIQATTKRPIRRIRIPRETAVYGRDKEIATLSALFEQAKAGDGQVVLIEGEAGIGKSRLIDEFISRLHRDGEDLNFLFGSYPPSGAATASGAFSAAYREHFGEGGSADYLPQTPILIPAFDALLKGESAPSGVELLTKDSLQTCFVNVTRSLAAERVTIVLIDDLHFAPDEGRALFSSLAMAAPGARLLLIGTTRPGTSQEWTAGLTRLDYTSQLQVERLFPKDLVRLLHDTLKSERLAAALGNQIALKSDGNPFFVFEIIRGLREGQFITQKDDGTWVSTRVIDEIQIPSSVLDLVNARVADLTEEERDLLDVACCWGFEFDPGLIGEVLGLGRIPLLKRFGQIERKHRLVRAAGRHMVFDHHQVQEALYGSLLEQLREEYHSALAEALETRTKAADKDPETLDGALCVDLCEHYLKGARGESALRYLPAAQAHLTSGYLHAEMAALTERALAAPDLLAGAERAETLLRLAKALNRLGRRTRQEECALEAERLADAADDNELRGKAAHSLGILLFRTSRQTEAETAQRRVLEIAVARGDRKAEAGATGNLGNVFTAQGRLPEAQEYLERSLALSREIGDRQGEAGATGSLGAVFYAQGRMPEAQEHMERFLALSREIGDRVGEAGATGNLGAVFQAQGRLPEAREHLERQLALSREIGDRQGEAISTGSLGYVFRAHGRLPEAQEHHERWLALSREIGDRQSEAGSLFNLGQLRLALGDRRGARQHLEASLALCREIGLRDTEACALWGLGSVADEEGDGVAATTWIEESLALCREIGRGHEVAESLIALGDLRRRAGDVDGARAALEEAATLSNELGLKNEVAHALAQLACLPDGDATAAEAALADAGESGDDPEERLHLWKATGDRAHLAGAKRLLDESLAKMPEEYHEAMLTNLRVNREIMAAWRAEFGDDGQ